MAPVPDAKCLGHFGSKRRACFVLVLSWCPASVWRRGERVRASFKSEEASTARPRDRAPPSPTGERPRDERSRAPQGSRDRPRAHRAGGSTDPRPQGSRDDARATPAASATTMEGSWWRARRREAEGCIGFVASALARSGRTRHRKPRLNFFSPFSVRFSVPRDSKKTKLEFRWDFVP